VKQVTTYVGVDAHKKDLFIAMLVGDRTAPVTWQVANEPQAVRRLVRKLEREAPGPVRVCYEAGPCGYALQRHMTTPRVACQVIAPALIPRKPGERIKTNQRDARKLVELLRAGLLTEVQPPTPEAEAVRDLCRARDDAREDLQRARHRLASCCSVAACITAGAIGRARIGSGSTACSGLSRPSVWSSTTIGWRSIISRLG
jgi:transposase